VDVYYIEQLGWIWFTLYNSFTFANLTCLCLGATFMARKEGPWLGIFVCYLFDYHFLFYEGYDRGSLTVT